MKKYYITFGQIHCHKINNQTFDHNCIGIITAENYEQARSKVFEITDGKFCFMYNSEEEVGLEFYSRGLIPMN